MTPVDVAAEVAVLGRDPLAVTEFESAQRASGAPRITLAGTFLLPSERPTVRPFVEVRVGGWHAEYDTTLAYDATVLHFDGDLGFRLLPFAPVQKEGVWAPRPFVDFTLGARAWQLLQPWWNDEFLFGSAVGAAAGVTVGDSRRNLVVRVRYEAEVGPAVSGVLDSALSDLEWTVDPAGGRLGVAVGFGWR